MTTTSTLSAGLRRLALGATRHARPLQSQTRSYQSVSGAILPRRPAAAPSTRTIHRLARRNFSVTATTFHGHLGTPKPGEELYVTFVDKEGDEHKIAVCEGDNLLDIAQEHELEMEGACGGSCACSTCHVIVADEALYDQMPEPEDDENDMLDLAFGLTETSRLGCQVKMAKELDGLVVKLPSMTRNLQASDFK